MSTQSIRLARAIHLQEAVRAVRLPHKELVSCFKKAELHPGDIRFSGTPAEWTHFFRPFSKRSEQLHTLALRLVGALSKKEALARSQAEQWKEIEVVFPGEMLYPDIFYQLDSPPLCLYCKGRTSLLQEKNKVSIVGTRTPSPYGERLCRRLVSEWAAWGVTLVSGLAAGIDGLTHRHTLAQGGKTIGILGCGPDRIYPPENADLYAKMSCDGLIITEFPPGTPPLRQHFPARNRLIAALGRCLLVLEAAKRSGTMITTDMALSLGIPILCLPGAVDAPQSKGTNALIQDGACPLLEAADLLPYLDLITPRDLPTGDLSGLAGRRTPDSNQADCQDNRTKQADSALKQYDKTDRPRFALLFNLLTAGPLAGHELADRMQVDTRTFLFLVGRAELAGDVVKADGLYHLRTGYVDRK